MIIVADSSPVIGLASINKLHLLNKLCDGYYISEEVYKEIIEYDKPFAKSLKFFFASNIKKVKNTLAVKLLTNDIDKGEAESIVLALENNIGIILIDDLKGRRIAKQNGLEVLGTLGLLLQAKKKGFISSIKKEMDSLIAHDFRISKRLYKEVLLLAGEEE